MDGCKSVGRLDFDHDHGFDQEVESDLTLQLRALVTHRDRHLPLHPKTPEPQLSTERHFVDRFEQPWPQLPMYLDGCSDDRLRPHQSPFLRAPRALRAFVVNHRRRMARRTRPVVPQRHDQTPSYAARYTPQTSRSVSLISPSVAR